MMYIMTAALRDFILNVLDLHFVILWQFVSLEVGYI